MRIFLIFWVGVYSFLLTFGGGIGTAQGDLLSSITSAVSKIASPSPSPTPLTIADLRKKLSQWSAAIGGAVPSSTPTITSLTIRTPCLEPNEASGARTDFILCNNVLRIPGVGGKPATGLLDKIEIYYRDAADCYYQKFIAEGLKAKDSNGLCIGSPLSPSSVVCDISSENGSNHLGESCGGKEGGGYESSHLRGIRIEAWKFFTSQVVKEIATTHSLNLSKGCIQQGLNYQEANDEAKDLSDQLFSGVQALPSPVYSGQASLCDSDYNQMKAMTQGMSDASTLLSVPKGAECLMESSRAQRTGLFEYAVHCEIDSRIEKFFATALPSEYNSIKGEVVDPCVDEAEGEKTQAKAKSRFHSCYDWRIEDFFTRFNNSHFPPG